MAEGGNAGKGATSMLPAPLGLAQRVFFTGDSIQLPHFDLKAALQAENMRRMYSEDSGELDLDDVPFDVQPASPPATPLASTSTSPATVSAPWEGLTDTTLRQTNASQRVSGDNPPPPKPIAVVHASEALPLPVQLAADDFRPTRVAWTRLTRQLEHPYLDRWQDAELLKAHLNYFEWDGRTTHAFVEAKGRIVGALIGTPKDPTWPAVITRATEALRREWQGMPLPLAAYAHRRGSFAQDPLGRSFGGRKTVELHCSRHALSGLFLLALPLSRLLKPGVLRSGVIRAIATPSQTRIWSSHGPWKTSATLAT
ncbi:hypothetical protein MSAN_01213300 [Mycena sanguinolenta]|uniref:Uncharacterized protein n=1 Tax=Mycena sanguinolenta TaxID=230812 RepID=A0A8H6YCV0_9AGAR|nr:hypothetical protein MSAN_01213300 [Mycena sanguinolenta]